MYVFVLVSKIVTLVLMALSSAALIFAILKQSGNTEGVTAIQGGSASSSDSFYGKNRGKKLENQLRKWTVISGVMLSLSAVAFYVLQLLVS